MIVDNIHYERPDFKHKEGLAHSGEEGENKENIGIMRERASSENEEENIDNRGKRKADGAELLLAEFSYELAHEGKENRHRAVGADGNQRKQTGLREIILEEIVERGLIIHLERDEKHGNDAEGNEREI